MNNGENIYKPVMVIECGHCQKAALFWRTVKEGHPPRLAFKNLPREGEMVMSNQTILLACPGCAKDLDIVLNEHNKSLVLQ